MTNSMVMPHDSVFKACRAFYNLSTTEVIIIEYLYNHGTFVGDAQQLARRLGVAYAQVTSALTSLDDARIVLRNTTGDKKVRMRALALCPHWEYNMIANAENDTTIKNKRTSQSA